MKVFVYFNLHKKCWSVKAMEGEKKGKVIAHEDFVVLSNAYPKVSEAGRQRVLREKRKNVHAGVVGEWQTDEVDCSSTVYVPHMVSYNPYKGSAFVYRDREWAEWTGSDMVLMNADATDKVMVFDPEPVF